MLTKEQLNELQCRIGYPFANAEYLKRALMHSSYVPGVGGDNERMEFLGDAVLELCVSEELFFRFPEMQEGKLTKSRASIVCESALCEAANTVKECRTPITVTGCDTPLPIMADRTLLERALLNLLANALQYTRDGNSITVSLKVQGNNAVITVADRGAGMLPQTLAQAAEPFFSAEPADDGGIRPGLGLGLIVAKLAAELHAGSLLLTGEHGEGTTAALTLPITPCESETLRSKSASYTADSFSGLYIELCRSCTLPH
ncbi:MAG: hypothetical protein IKV55_03325 [Oscillospiraceae bacterium]|nr:hypothetical protein [Oscillospiraceae bacterium]